MSATDGIAVVAGSPARLARALTDRDADTPVRPGAWTAGEYLWHLVDVLRSGEERFRTLALDPSRGFASWDENELARARGYRSLSPVVGLEEYEGAARSWVEAAHAAPSEVAALHPEFGTLDALGVIRRNAHEVLHHVADVDGTIG